MYFGSICLTKLVVVVSNITDLITRHESFNFIKRDKQQENPGVGEIGPLLSFPLSAPHVEVVSI